MIKLRHRWFWATLALICVTEVIAGQSLSGPTSGTDAPLDSWPPIPPAGPYSYGYGVSGAVDDPVAGFVGPAGMGVAPYFGLYSSQQVNPIFQGWATQVVDYAPSDPESIDPVWMNPANALGPSSGDVDHVVSLGDLSAQDLADGKQPGAITLAAASGIGDGPGPDFVLFGNSFAVGTKIWAKMAYVEVSTDGVNFARFPNINTNPRPNGVQWPYMVSDPTRVYNLFGKALNAYGSSWGTPFDLADLRTHPAVLAGLVDLNNIRYVRLIAVVGAGSDIDSYGDIIYSPWLTRGSPGPEVQALGVLNVASPALQPFNTGQPGPLVSAQTTSPTRSDGASPLEKAPTHAGSPAAVYGGVMTMAAAVDDLSRSETSWEHDANALLVAMANSSGQDFPGTDFTETSVAPGDNFTSESLIVQDSTTSVPVSLRSAPPGFNSAWNAASLTQVSQLNTRRPGAANTSLPVHLPVTSAYPLAARGVQQGEYFFEFIGGITSRPMVMAILVLAGLLLIIGRALLQRHR